MSNPEERATQVLVEKAIGKTSSGSSDWQKVWEEVKARAADSDEVAFECVEKVANGNWSVGSSHRGDAMGFMKQLRGTNTQPKERDRGTERSQKKACRLRATRRRVVQGIAAFGMFSAMVGTTAAHTRNRAELGSHTVDQAGTGTWHSVSLDHTYDDPVVIIKPSSFDGGQPCHVRLRNVGGQSFEFKLEEWEYLDGAHISETLHFIAIEKGEHGVNDGNLNLNIHAGHVETDEDAEPGFSLHKNPPVVLAQPQTFRGPDPIVSRVSDVQSNGKNTEFNLRLQEEEANGNHLAERIGYVAIESRIGNFYEIPMEAARTADIVTDEWQRIDFHRSYMTPRFLADIQTLDGKDTAGVRYRNLTSTGVEIFVEEEQSQDSETNHKTETIGYLVADAGQQLLIVGDAESGTVTVRQPDADSWHQVSFLQSYDDPVVIMEPSSFNGGQPCHVRLRNVGEGSFEFKLEEWEYLDGGHISETLHFIAIEKGKYGEWSNRPHIHAGFVETDQEPQPGNSYHNNRPVVLAQPQTYRGGDPIVSRVSDVKSNGKRTEFNLRLQEEEANGNHLAERIGYIAVLPRTDDFEFGKTRMEAGQTSKPVTDEWYPIGFDRSYTNPRFMADMQTLDGKDTAGVRYRNLTSTGVEVFVEEEQSGDPETNHLAEEIGYLVIEGT